LGIPVLVEKAVALGYSREHATQSLKWVLCRVFLHMPYTVLTAVHKKIDPFKAQQ